MSTMQNNLKTSFCGMTLNSPIVLLSGCVGFGEEYTRIKGFSNSDVGAVKLEKYLQVFDILISSMYPVSSALNTDPL